MPAIMPIRSRREEASNTPAPSPAAAAAAPAKPAAKVPVTQQQQQQAKPTATPKQQAPPKPQAPKKQDGVIRLSFDAPKTSTSARRAAQPAAGRAGTAEAAPKADGEATGSGTKVKLKLKPSEARAQASKRAEALARCGAAATPISPLLALSSVLRPMSGC